MQFKIWKTVKLGTGPRTGDDFRRALHDNGFHCSADIISEPAFTAATQEIEVDLVKVTVAELGFGNRVLLEQIYKRAKEFGLELCTAEVGPQLRLRYRDQPKEESIIVAMEPIIDSDGTPYVFIVECAAWLNAIRGNLTTWDPADMWVFVRPRK